MVAVRILLLFGTQLVSGVSSQNVSTDVCRAPKPTVGTMKQGQPQNRRAYKVGANTFHIPVLDYLTDLIGADFDPPISFTRSSANLYLKSSTVQESVAMEYDFMLANPYAASCYESEGQAVSLATQLVLLRDTNNVFNLTRYGAALYTLQNRTDITTVADVKGKKIGSNKITALATHLCYSVLLRNGVHHLQDPEQTIFFRNSSQALQALLRGDIDVGCASTGTLERDLKDDGAGTLHNKIRILHAQNHTLRDGENELLFPFAISSPLVPGYPFVAFPHVEQSVQIRVQKELLAMRDHADVAPALLACLRAAPEAAQCTIVATTNSTSSNTTSDDDGNLYYTDECLETCFASLAVGTIRNCDTTPRLALKAFDALNASGLVGFTKPLQNLLLRDIQETTGFLIKDDSDQKEEESASATTRCVRLKNIADAVTCPDGHFARSSLEIVQQCNVSGLQCFGRDCICRPCVKAYEVDFFAPRAAIDERDKDNDNNNNGGVGSGCSKFSICGTVEQEHVLSFRAIDNKGRPNASMTRALLREDESEEPFAFEHVNGTFFQYNFTASHSPVGQQVLKIRINNEEIPESPFRINIVKRDCVADTGDERREADELGQCVCQSGTVELLSSDKCVPLATLVPSILVPSIAVLLSILVCVCLGRKRKNEDSVWMVRKEEISFATPPQVLGRGVFGVILLGEFRGTQVAVKRVIPPRGMKSTAKDDFRADDDVETGEDASQAALSRSELTSTNGYTGNRGKGSPAASAPDKSTAPVRDGLSELAARLSAAGMVHRSGSDAMPHYEMKKLKKDFIAEMRSTIFVGLLLFVFHCHLNFSDNVAVTACFFAHLRIYKSSVGFAIPTLPR